MAEGTTTYSISINSTNATYSPSTTSITSEKILTYTFTANDGYEFPEYYSQLVYVENTTAGCTIKRVSSTEITIVLEGNSLTNHPTITVEAIETKYKISLDLTDCVLATNNPTGISPNGIAILTFIPYAGYYFKGTSVEALIGATYNSYDILRNGNISVEIGNPTSDVTITIKAVKDANYKPVYKYSNNSWISQTAYQYISSAWIKISQRIFYPINVTNTNSLAHSNNPTTITSTGKRELKFTPNTGYGWDENAITITGAEAKQEIKTTIESVVFDGEEIETITYDDNEVSSVEYVTETGKGDLTVTISNATESVNLNVTPSPLKYSATYNLTECDGDKLDYFEYGKSYTLTFTANDGYTFSEKVEASGITIDNYKITNSGKTATLTLSNPTSDVTITCTCLVAYSITWNVSNAYYYQISENNYNLDSINASEEKIYGVEVKNGYVIRFKKGDYSITGYDSGAIFDEYVFNGNIYSLKFYLKGENLTGDITIDVTAIADTGEATTLRNTNWLLNETLTAPSFEPDTTGRYTKYKKFAIYGESNYTRDGESDSEVMEEILFHFVDSSFVGFEIKGNHLWKTYYTDNSEEIDVQAVGNDGMEDELSPSGQYIRQFCTSGISYSELQAVAFDKSSAEGQTIRSIKIYDMDSDKGEYYVNQDNEELIAWFNSNLTLIKD